MGKDVVLKRLLGKSLEGFLNAEMSDHLGYVKHSVKVNKSGNSRNGDKKKTVLSEQGAIELKVPHDRNGTFNPTIVPKHSRRLGSLEEAVLSLYFMVYIVKIDIVKKVNIEFVLNIFIGTHQLAN